MQMAASTGLQSRPSNSFKYSFFQHLLSVNDSLSIMLNRESIKKNPCPYDLRKQMSGKETTTKEYDKFLELKAL